MPFTEHATEYCRNSHVLQACRNISNKAIRYTASDCCVCSEINIFFVVTPCINNIQHFIFQVMDTTLKNVELLKHFKISKTAPTCFGLQGKHHQGATVST